MAESVFQNIRSVIIRDIILLAREKYVYPEMGETIASEIQTKLDEGEYDALVDEQELALRLTLDLRSISNDHHWTVVYDPQGAAGHIDPETEADKDRMARYLAKVRKSNFGFERVERLKGNIGYLDLRRFEPSEYGGETAVAAMNFLANCDALIIDLRQNHGGYPSMVQLITSYLTGPEPRHINTFYYRPTDETQQFWTFPYVPGKRRPDTPVYVLTSNATGSAPEEFAYNLKQMDRATLVGETTLGAAHPVTKETVQGELAVFLPYGRAINPITGGNWEGRGVEPHIPVPAEDALKTAHLRAVDHLISNSQDENERNELEWLAEIIESEYTPVVLEEAELSRYMGEFGQRRFFIENGELVYSHQEVGASWKLLPMAKTRFRLDEDMKFEFGVGGDGEASAVKITYRDGRPGVVEKRTG